MPAPRVPSVVLTVPGHGVAAHPCPDDPDRLAVVVDALTAGLAPDRLPTAVWHYDPAKGDA